MREHICMNIERSVSIQREGTNFKTTWRTPMNKNEKNKPNREIGKTDTYTLYGRAI